MNVVAAIGNLTRNPELRTTATGKSVCRFTIAVNGIKKKDSENQRVDYIPCVCWDNVAENAAKYLTQGKMVAIKGSLRSGKYTGDDGKTKFTLEVELDKYDGLKYLSGGSRDNRQEQQSIQEEPQAPEVDEQTGYTKVDTDQLPF